MKFAQIKKLLSAAETRKRIESAELAALRAARQALEEDAERLMAAAQESRLANDHDLSGVDLANFGRNLDQLYSAVDKLRTKAAEYEAPIRDQENKVRASLRREMAWETLFDAARRERRKALQNRDELNREETRLKVLATQVRSRGRNLQSG